MSLSKKNILLCVSGGIAAYKACELTSRLTKAGASVHVIMTTAAQSFVGAATFQALSRNPVHDDLFTEKSDHQIAHIDLADQADLIIVAPATANIIAKMANGIADDMATTAILATKAPVWVAPAMNVNMYNHPAVQSNLQRLNELGYRLLEPGVGSLACGWIGKGRMAEPEEIVTAIGQHFTAKVDKDLSGKRLLVTAGPTRESIDPVRFLTNHSSGKMGYAIAEAAAERGASVTLVSGPTSLEPPVGVDTVQVDSAEDMYNEVTARFDDLDAVIKVAAVADYRPKTVAKNKIKKNDGDWTMELVRNPDILEELGHRKKRQILIGFTAETERLDEFAQKKLKKKNLDMVVANNIGESDAGFAGDDNRVAFHFKDGSKRQLDLMPKRSVASEICRELHRLLESEGGYDR